MTGHGTLAAEASALLAALSERLEPMAARDASETAAEPHDQFRCTGCPICAVITYAKADRGELAGQLAQGALLVVNALRGYLDQAADPATHHQSRDESRSVQRIDIS